MAVNKEALKKHHFWILVGLTPLMVLIAIISLDSSVGAGIASKLKEQSEAKKAMQGKESPKSDKLISGFDGQLEELGHKRTDLWKENWERQIGLSAKKVGGKDVLVQDPVRNLLRWPNSRLLNKFNYTPEYATNKSQLKFGDRIPEESGEDNEFKKPEVYLAEFSNPYLKDPAREPEKRTGMADRVYPTEFAGGWQAVLRHVQTPSGWGDFKPTSEQLWLALEDIWVQRAALDAVKSVNDLIGTFQRAPRYDANNAPIPDAPLERAFLSRIWYVTLKVAQRPGDGRFVITGTLRNITDRLQMLGTGNTMVLNVWLSTLPGAQPIPFRIGGEFVAGGATVPITQAEEHVLPAGTTVEEIARVEQVFDTRTVPVRRIDHLALGKRDSRYTAFPLLEPLFEKFIKEAEAKAAGADSGAGSGSPMGGGGAPPGVGSSGGPPPGMGSKPTPGSGGGSGSSGGAQGQLEGGGTVAAVVDGNRKRYVDVTKQIRRMPIGITVIVDQAYVDDVLRAYANLPMRFQITQYHWQRFRGSLGGSGSGGSSGFGGEGEIAGPAKGLAGAGGIKFGSGGFSPPGFGSPPGPMGIGGGPGPMGPPGFGPPSGGGFAGGGSTGAFTEAQLTAGLVELTIYGIVSIYEKYETTEPAATTP